MPVVVGLGNPEQSLHATAHNVGYRFVETIANSAGASWNDTAEGASCEARLGSSPVLLFKPRASMNRSGAQLRNYLDSIERSLADCIIVYDDFDLPLGEFRSRNRGGDGGHKGVQSIITAFGTAEFRRLRIGVRAEGDVRKAEDLVLSVLDARNEQILSSGLNRAVTAVEDLLTAMSRPGQGVHTTSAEEPSPPSNDAQTSAG